MEYGELVPRSALYHVTVMLGGVVLQSMLSCIILLCRLHYNTAGPAVLALLGRNFGAGLCQPIIQIGLIASQVHDIPWCLASLISTNFLKHRKMMY
jgi:hypothetical protein